MTYPILLSRDAPPLAAFGTRLFLRIDQVAKLCSEYTAHDWRFFDMYKDSVSAVARRRALVSKAAALINYDRFMVNADRPLSIFLGLRK